MALQHGQSCRRWKWIAYNDLEPVDSPLARGAAGEQYVEGLHRSRQWWAD